MTDVCIHGFERDGCLICRTLGAGESAKATRVAEQTGLPYQGRAAPERPDVVYVPGEAGIRRRRSLTGSLIVALVALLALGAAAWILVGLVFTVLHVLELIAVGAGCGWVGYRIGHFRGARQARSRGPAGGR